MTVPSFSRYVSSDIFQFLLELSSVVIAESGELC